MLIDVIEPLKCALGKVLRLSKHKQAVAAELLEQLAQSDAAPYALSPVQRMVVREALARSIQGDFADKADVDAMLRRQWN